MKKILIVIAPLALCGCVAADQVLAHQDAIQAVATQAIPVATTVGTVFGVPWVGPVVAIATSILAAAFGVHRKVGDLISVIQPMQQADDK